MSETYCSGCDCATVSVKKGRCSYVCAKCNHDKSLSDFFQYELTRKKSNELMLEEKI